MAFTGGFKYRHDKGGMALDGKVLRPMKKGLGTLVLFKDGKVSIGKWGRDWKSLTPRMRDMRQGFILVDHGKYCDNPLFNIYSQDKNTYVRRSALGVTTHGALVYATGNNLSAKGLARAMMAAGVVSAVHLEMNLSRVLCGVPKNKNGELTLVPLTIRCCDPKSLAGTRERDFMYITKTANSDGSQPAMTGSQSGTLQRMLELQAAMSSQRKVSENKPNRPSNSAPQPL